MKLIIPNTLAIETEFKTKSSQGWEVCSLYIDKNGFYDAILKRPNSKIYGDKPNQLGQYVVAIDYDITDGTWNQGLYDNKDWQRAYNRLLKYYELGK